MTIRSEDLRGLYRQETDQRVRVEASIEFLKHYIDTYGYETCNGSGHVFSNDILYGLGVALDPDKHYFNKGFRLFKDKLRNHLDKKQYLEFNGENPQKAGETI